MKSKEFGASYRTYRAESQSMLVENQLAQPHSSVRVLTESINRSPVEFMQYFRTIMEAPPKVRVEPTLPQTPTATPGGQSSPASSSQQSMFTRSSSIMGPDGKPIKTQTPVDSQKVQRAFTTMRQASAATDEVRLTMTLRGNSAKVAEMVEKGLQLRSMTPEIVKAVEQLPPEKKTIVKRMFGWLKNALGSPISTASWLIKSLTTVALIYTILDWFLYLVTDRNLIGWGERALEAIRGWLSSSKETTTPPSPSDNVTPLPLPQSGGTPPTPRQQPETPANTQQPETPAGTGGKTKTDQDIKRAIENLWGSLDYTLTSLTA